MKKQFIILSSILLLTANLFSLSIYHSTLNTTGALMITVLNIGQGDSILIKTPSNKYGLIDGGIGDFSIEAVERNSTASIKEFEFVIATHPDSDHIEGLIEVAKRYKVNNFFISNLNKDSEIYSALKEVIAKKDIKNFEINSLNDFTLDSVNFDVIWPTNDINPRLITESNETSTGILISYENFTFLTAGDLSIESELKMLDNIALTNLDLIKISHHGSKSSTSDVYIDTLKPKVGLISVGLNNSYNHPSGEVLKTLENKDIDIYRTDYDGDIIITYLEESFRIKTETKEKMYDS